MSSNARPGLDEPTEEWVLSRGNVGVLVAAIVAACLAIVGAIIWTSAPPGTANNGAPPAPVATTPDTTPGDASPSASASAMPSTSAVAAPSGVLPWIDTAAPPVDDSLPPSHPASPACVAGALDATARIGNGAAAGTAYTSIEVINASTAPCSVGGYPTVEYVDPDTHDKKAVPLDHDTTTGTSTAPVTLLPGEAGRFTMRRTNGYGGYPSTAPECAHPHTYNNLDLKMPDGSRYDLGGLDISVQCGTITVVPWGAAPLPTRLLGLVADITAPATVKAGATLDYTVSLTNMTAATITLDPCPGYQELLTAQKSYQLNCLVPTIAPHATVRYDMRIPVDASAPVGQEQILWSLVGRDGFIVTDATQNIAITH
jgi:uncharacterized protein DUF4232